MTITGKKVLMVEDDAIIAISEIKTLKDNGLEVHLVPCGEMAIDFFRSQQKADLVLMDIDLGKGMSGIEAARQILAVQDLPLIFLSSHTEKDLVALTEDITAYGYIVKHSEPMVMVSSIKMAIKLHQAKILAQQSAQETVRVLQNMTQFITYSPAAIAMFDTDMRYLAVSRQFAADYNLTERDLLGKSHYEVFPEIPSRWKDIHRRCLAGATESAELDEFYRQDGTVDFIKWTITPWYTSSGAIGGIVLFSMVLNKVLKKYRTLLANGIDQP